MAETQRESTQNPPPAEKGGPLFPRAWNWKILLPGLLAMAIAPALLPWSESIWKGVYGFIYALPLRGFFSVAKQVPVGPTITTIFLIIWVYDRPKRNTLLILLAALLISGAATHLLKHTLRRARPEYGMLMKSDEREWIEDYLEINPASRAKPEKGDQWLAFSLEGPFFMGRFNSFPSGHTSAAFALAAFLMIAYPKLNWLWLIWAVGCGLARIRFRMHYPEDVLFGAGLGWVTARFLFAWPRLALWSDRLAAFLENKGLKGRDH